MEKTTTILTLILFVMAGSMGCKEAGIQSNDLITIDVTSKYPKKELIIQDFLDVEYIPLESTDEFLTSGYVQAISDDILLIRNVNRGGAGDIFFFDRKTGKGVRKINRRGQGAGEYTNISGLIVLDEDNDEMFINCGGLRKIMVYDLAGNFKRSLHYKDGGEESGKFSKEIYYSPIYNLDKHHLICRDSGSGRNFMGMGDYDVDLEPRNTYFIISKQDGTITKEIEIPFEKKISQVVFPSGGGVGVVNNPGLIPYQENWILVEPSADTIYTYSADHRMKPIIVRTPSIQSMDPGVFLFPGVITGRYCFLQAIKKEYDETEPGSNLLTAELVYDREEKKTYEYKLYNNDFTNKRPTRNLVLALPEITIVNNNEIAFIEMIEAYELVEAYNEGQLKGKLKEIAAGLHEESNPVILLGKYK